MNPQGLYFISTTQYYYKIRLVPKLLIHNSKRHTKRYRQHASHQYLYCLGWPPQKAVLKLLKALLI